MTERISVSPLAIDLGGVNTGVYMSHYLKGELPQAEHGIMATVVMPKDGDKITLSQVKRTMARHRMRNYKRRKMAKRLLRLVVCDGLSVSCDQGQWQALTGLLNRRGYNRIEVELDLSPLEQVDAYWFAELLPEHFSAGDSLIEQWYAKQDDKAAVRDLQREAVFGLSDKDRKAQLFKYADIDKEEREKLLAAFKCMKEALEKVLQSEDLGHRHRREYLVAIEQEIARDGRLRALAAQIGAERLYRIIGNISNFQLRTLRWYFNDETMQAQDSYDAAKLKQVVLRWLQGWHCDSTSRANRERVLAYLAQHENVVDALAAIDPQLTIPPYEDQNNRRPPKDQTLWLNPAALNQIYGEQWTIWANNLWRSQPDWAEGLEWVVASSDSTAKKLYERKSRLPSSKRVPLSDKLYQLSIFLQRILDRSKALDPYALRGLIDARPAQHKEVARAKLARDLGSQHLDAFLQFCGRYYRELELAKQGLWRESNENLFERADINPPSKQKILPLLVGNILGEQFDAEKLNEFSKELWRKRSGKSTLKGTAEKIEALRKQHGNSFNEQLKRVVYLMEISKQPEKSLNAEEKALWQNYQNCRKAAAAIAAFYDHSAAHQQRYDNAYSIAQLYTLLETDRNGFSKVSLAAHRELQWRMQPVAVEENAFAAHCSRLVADSVRPFDGVLRRMLDRAAYDIAKTKAAQVMQSHAEGVQEIHIPIAVEENRFSFTMGLADIKGDGKKRKKLAELLERQQDKWLHKFDRIQQASPCCPYTGERIAAANGEYDHIVPRAASWAGGGTVFDSEANLIWCSRKGNQLKGKQRYGLAQLHGNYLQAVFGSQNLADISQCIEREIAALPKQFIFQDLSPAQQIAVRHALFLTADSEALQKVQAALATQQKSRVNGTQAWLVRQIIDKLDAELDAWCKQNGVHLHYYAARVNAEKTSAARNLLAQNAPELAKQLPQPVASHAIDALCALVVAADTFGEVLGFGEGASEDAVFIQTLIPAKIDVVGVERKARYNKRNIFSQPVFKESIYSERFLPLWCGRGEIRVGFNPDAEALQWEIKQPLDLLELLAPLLEQQLNFTAALAASKFTKLSVERVKAFTLLERVALQAFDEVASEQADVLDALRYTVAKKECQSVIYDTAKNCFQNKNDILKDKKFTIGIEYKEHKRYGKLKGKLQLPAKRDWQRLLEQPILADKLGTKAENIDWLSFGQQYFGSGANRAHRKARRVFSLPVVDSPSGGYRIKRKAEKGDDLWQVVTLDGTASEGFAVIDGKIDWAQLVPIAALRATGIVALGQRWQPAPEAVVKFDKWLPLACGIDGVQELAMAPGTKGRCYLRVAQTFADFQRWMNSCDFNAESKFIMPAEIKIADGKAFKQCHQSDLLGAPRSNLFIEQLGETVCYWYIAEGTSAAMKQAYQQAYTEIIANS